MPTPTTFGTPLSAHDEAESFRHCLYFLVCDATEGPLMGLFKIGITDCFPARHQEHSRVWGTFDLRRSALLRARSREEVLRLETALRHLYGDCSAEHRAEARGRVLTSEDFIAMGSWRRHPGRCDKGYKEFYATGCLEAMLASIKDWLATRGQRSAGVRVQRGVNPADCLTRTRNTGSRLTRGECRELREHRRAATRQLAEKMRAESNKVMPQVLDFALAYQGLLIGVELGPWRKSRAVGNAAQGKYGLVYLYFRLLEHMIHQEDPRVHAWIAAQHRLKDNFEPVTVLAKSADLVGPSRRKYDSDLREGVYTLVGWGSCTTGHLPHPHPLEMVCVRAGSCYSDPFNPLFERFEELARRVESSRTWSQKEFCW